MADLRLSPDELRPLVQQVVSEVLTAMEHRRLLLNDKLALTEPEAAPLLSLNPWQLRDLRLAGKIGYSRVVGGRVRYTAQDLDNYLRRHHDGGTD
jgi:Helix-turn-helix domain